MPPKKRKRKAKTPKSTQTQKQSQRVTINIGKTTKSAPRKSSGAGRLAPPSHAHNLAPTFVTAPQVDYTPLLAMIQHHSKPIVQEPSVPLQNAVTPLSSANTEINNTTAQQKAGEAAIRRAGKTAGNFQTQPSESSYYRSDTSSSESSSSESSKSDEKVARQIQAKADIEDEKEFDEKQQERRRQQHTQRAVEAEPITVAVGQPAEQLESELIKKGMSLGKQQAEEEAAQKRLQRRLQEKKEKEAELKAIEERREQRKTKAKELSAEITKTKPKSFTQVQKDEFRRQTSLAGLNLGDLSEPAQRRIRETRTPQKRLEEE